MEDYLKSPEEKMIKSKKVLEADLAAIRAGRANPAVLDKLSVDYYGTPTPVNQLAAVSVAEARVLVIQPWDNKSIKNIEKAIQASDIGINPTNDGRVIRLVFPQLTEERRRDLSKQVRSMGEDGKVAVRSIRRDALEKFKTLKKSSEITEDDLKDLEGDMQKMTDRFCKEIDVIIKAKETELMEI